MPQQQQHKSICPHCEQEHDEELDELTDFAATMAEEFTEHAFPKIWKQTKRDLKEMGKRDIAQTMFYTGATQMLAVFMQMTHDFPQEE